MKHFLPLMILCSCGVAAIAQDVTTQISVDTASHQQPADADYVLGPGDQIRIHIINVDEVPKDPIVIGLDGAISLPFVGRVVVGGMTTAQAEAELDRRYKEYLLHPDISVTVVEFQSQPVSVFGAVRTPGVQQVQGNRTVVETLSMAGGLADNAGSRLKVTRSLKWGALPLPNAAQDPTGQFSVAEISLKSLFEARNPEENILVKPNDVISVPAADTVYVLGHVLKAGPYTIRERNSMTALQAISMAGGMDNVAQPKHARILRRQPGQMELTEIAVNMKDVMEGQTPDITMQPEDILFIPNNVPKSSLLRALDVAIQMGTGVVVWNRY